MDPQEAIKELERKLFSDPDMAKLSYDEQKRVRKNLYSNILGKNDQDYLALGPEQQNRVLDTIVSSRRPVFKDPAGAQQAESIISRAEQGELTGIEEAWSPMLETFMKDSIIGRLAVKPAFNIAAKMTGERLAPLLSLTTLTGTDADKAYSYVKDQTIRNNKEAAKTFKSGEVMGNVMGFATDFIHMHGSWAKITNPMVAAATQKASLGLKGIKATFVRANVPAIVSAASSGAYGLFREQFLGVVNDEDERKQDSYKKVLKTLGQYALLDYTINLTAGLVLPYFKVLRHLKTGKANDALQKFSPEELDNLITQASNGNTASELLEQMDPVSKHYILGQAALRNAANNLDDAVRLRPYDDMLLKANDAGMTVYQDPNDGLYYLYRASKSNKDITVTTTTDVVEARREIARGLDETLSTIKEPARATEFQARHEQFLNYAKTEKLIDASYDPRKVAGELDKKTAKLVKPRGTAEKYISSIDRPYVGRNEVEGYQKAFGASEDSFVGTFKTDVSEETLGRISKGQRIFKPGSSVPIKNTDTGQAEVFVMLKKPIRPKDAVSMKALSEANDLADKAIARGSTIDKITLRNMYLMDAGYDGIVKSRNAVEAFYPDKIKFIADRFDPITGKIGNISVLPTKSTPLGTKATIAQKFTATLGGKALANSEQAFADVASTFKGKLKSEDVRKFSAMYLENFGINGKNVKVVLGNAADELDSGAAYARIDRATGSVTLEIPNEITTPAAQQKFVGELFDELKNAVDTIGKGSVAGTAEKISTLISKSPARFTAPFTNVASNENWIRSVVQDTLQGSFSKTARGFEVTLKSGEKLFSASLEDLTNKVMVSTLDVSALRFDLARQGYSLAKVGEDLVVRGASLNVPVTAKTIPELIAKLDYVPQKISSRFAPKLATIRSDAVDITFENGIVVGSKRNIKKAFGQFENMDYMARLKKISSGDLGDVYVRPAGDYEAHIGYLGEIKRFKTIKEARHYISTGWKQFDNIQDLARKKGLEVWSERGALKLSDGADTFTVKTPEEAAAVFAKYPDTTAGPELFESIDPDSLNPIDKVLHNFNMSAITNWDDNVLKVSSEMAQSGGTKSFGLNSRQELRALVENMDYWAEKTLTELNQPELLRSYRNVETARRIADVEIENTRKAILGIFTDDNGKIVPLARRKAIYYHAGAQTVEEQANILSLHGELTSAEEVIVGNLRKLMGAEKGTVLTGLAGKFGVSPDDFINNYMPRIMDWATKNTAELNKMTSAEELFERALSSIHGTKAPPKLNAFFKNLRTSEVLAFKSIDDPIEALEHYSRVGHRQLYMGTAWEDLYGKLKTSGADARVHTRFNRYREQLMGVYKTSGEETAGAIGQGLSKLFGLKSGEDVTRAFFSLNYLANMGFRPWLALRNTTQVFTTLAPRFGNEWVVKSVDSVADMTEDYYKYLHKIGVIQEAPPIVNDIADSSSLLGRVTRKGLRMFKRSDDITRAIAYRTGELRFDYALTKMRKGTTNFEEFLKESGVSRMDDDTVREISKLFEANTDDAINAARTKFGTKIVDDTMFGYRSSQAPTAFSGSFWGKLFGQYGTYAAGYRANIYRAFQYGSAGERAAFVARFLGNQAALYGMFKMMGINATNFIPGSPALFGGGPLFEVGVALTQSASTNYKGQQARALLARKLLPLRYSGKKGLQLNYPELFPGSLQVRYAQKSLDYLDKGDPWRAFLAATTTPVADEE